MVRSKFSISHPVCRYTTWYFPVYRPTRETPEAVSQERIEVQGCYYARWKGIFKGYTLKGFLETINWGVVLKISKIKLKTKKQFLHQLFFQFCLCFFKALYVPYKHVKGFCWYSIGLGVMAISAEAVFGETRLGAYVFFSCSCL